MRIVLISEHYITCNSSDPEESVPVANKPPPGPAPAAMRPSFEDRQTSDPRFVQDNFKI